MVFTDVDVMIILKKSVMNIMRSGDLTAVVLKVHIFWDTVVYPGNFFRGGWGVQQIQLRTEGRHNGDLGAVNPLVRGSAQFANE
jgi:hypothetical protein